MKKLLMFLFAIAFSSVTWGQSAIIGTGTSTSNGSGADPLERYYNYEHFQIVYTAAELTAAGMPAGANINALGFSVSESAVSLANFTISMGATSQTLANPYISTGLSVVKTAFTYTPVVQVAGSFDMITFETPFIWDGASNIVVNTCTGSNPYTTPYGGVRYTAATSGAMRYVRTDGTANCATATNTNATYRPNIKFDYTPGTGNVVMPPSAFTAIATSSSNIDLAWTLNSNNNNVMILRNTTNTFGTPVDGTSYNVNDNLGGATVIYKSNGTSFSSNGLTSATPYYYKAYSVTSGDAYSTGAASASATTLCESENIPTSIQSFESISIPVCWSTSLLTGADNWAPAISNDGVPSPHTGTNFMGKVYTTSDALIYSQPINMTSASNGARIKVWIYRSASNLASDRIRFHINTTQSLTGATQLLEIFPKTSIAPTVATAGWYNYIVNIPISYNSNSSIYIIAQGTTSGGYSSYGLGFDDFSVEAIPSCVEPNTLAANTITNNSATATWVAGATETLWNLEYGVTGFTQGAGTLVNDLSSTTYNFTSLTGNTNYSFYVQSNCGGSTSTWSGPYSFKTLCDAISVPITQNFDGVTTPNLPDCWTKKIVSTSSATVTTTTTNHTTPNGVSFYNAGDIASQLFLISPKIVENLNTLRVKLWAYSYGTYPVKVGVMTDPTDAATFVEIASYPTSSTWTERITDLNSYSGTATYIAIKFVGTGTYQTIYVDDVSIDLLPSCLEPTALNSTSVTSNSATINWTASTSNPTSGYEYEVRTSEAAGSGLTGLVTLGTTAAGIVTANISSLTANTTYSFYVRSNCGSNYSSWTSAGSFFTGYCNPSATSVDGTGITNVTFGISPNVVNNTTANETNNYGNYSVQIGDLQRGAVSSLAITFNTSTFDYNTKIWIDFNDDLDFTDIGEEVYSGLSASTSPNTLNTTFIIPLSVSLGNHRLRIGAGDNSAPSSCAIGLTYTCFEDYTINVLEAPSCLAPTGVASSNISYTSADFSWIAPALGTPASYEWEVRSSGAAGSGATGLVTSGSVSSLSTTITGLNAASTYTMYVRSNCGVDFSSWTNGVAFTTSTCSLPTAVTASAITATTATISWTAPISNPVGYEYEIRTTGAAGSGASGLITSGTSTAPTVSANISGLTASTQYYVYVRSNCVTSVYGSWTSSVSFTTSCVAVQLFPFVESFVGGVVPPTSCWTKAGGQLTASTVLSGTGNWAIDDYLNSTSPVNKCAKDNVYSTSHYSWLITPQIDLGSGSTKYKLSFKLGLTLFGATTPAAQTGTDDKFAVVISTDGGLTWSNANTLRLWDNAGSPYIYNNIPNTGQLEFIDLSAYSGTIKIGFYGESTVSNADNDLFVDDISIVAKQAGLWTGATNNDWATATNWDNGIVPSAATNVTIPATATNFPTVNTSAEINNLTIESNASGTGSLLDNGNLTINGTATVKQYVVGDKWHLISSPIQNATANVFHLAAGQADIYIREFVGGIWNPTYITNLTTPIVTNRGYGIWADCITHSTPNPTISFTGVLNTGVQTLPTTGGNNWDLIGNPYTSAIDWDLIDPTNVAQSNISVAGSAVRVWNQTSNVYSAYSKLGGSINNGKRYIAPMQGFFVQSLDANGITLNDSYRVHNGQQFVKSTNSISDLMKITAQRNTYKDEINVVMNPIATNSYDFQYDATKLFVNDVNIPEIYTVSGNKNLVINIFGSAPIAIPMNIRMGVADNVTLTASEFANFDANVNITLEDMLTGTTQDLRQNPTYTFAATIGENANRFVLHFATPNGINEPNAGNISIYANNNNIYVNTTELVKEISVYNMLGQVITTISGNAKSLNTISMNNATGNYVVKVTTDKGVRTEKVFVK